WKERDEAMQSLVRLGRAAKAGLEALPADGDPEVVWRVKAALAEIAERAGREDLLEEMRNIALCEFLGEAGDARAVGTLLRILAAGPADPRPDLKIRAAYALGQLAGRLQPAQGDASARTLLALLARAASAVLEEPTGAPSGIDPRAAGDENREAIAKMRAWWEKKFGRTWIE